MTATRNELRLAPLAWAVAAATAGMLNTGTAQAQAFSPAWFASKGAAQQTAAATGYLPNGRPVSSLLNPTQQQQAANAQLQQSINNLGLLAQGIAAQQAAQLAARQSAAAGTVADGLAEGGLKVDTNSLTQGWINANAPTQTVANGKTTVTVQQTADKAILNWETFNVGRNTILNFAQDASWAVLNRVNDPLARPTQILGQINAPGTVMIVNRNGVIFGAGSQVNTRNLAVAAANITDAQFRDNGLYVDSSGSLPTFTDALGNIAVQAGAQISTSAATSATESGGYVLLLGSEVSNAGQINTPGGQTTLAAGDDFYIRKGVSTAGNATSTTRGNEVSTERHAGSTSGLVSNTGLITASTGDITLTGHTVVQAGVAVASTSVGTRGTIHLLNRAGDADGSVTLAEGSMTAVVLDTSSDTALDTQRDAAIKKLDGIAGTNNITTNFDNLSTITDRTDLSRIEIVSGNTVEFKEGSTTLATGGQIAVSAAQRSLVGNGALLDVSGAIGVNLAMESNNIVVNVQGNELRDAAANRDGTLLNNSDVWIDRRSLVLVPAGTDGYATDRWYTAGGLLEVSGYLATSGHTVGEWMAQGGTVSFSGSEVVTQARSDINLSGGTINVQSGYINQTWLKGTDGRLYEASTAPADLLYSGVYKGFEVTHARWGDNTTETYYNPLIAPASRLENGYTVGRDAGKLVIGTTSAVLEGNLTSEVYQGSRQTEAAQGNLDGYYQSQNAMARRAQLIVGGYKQVYDTSAGVLRYGVTPLAQQVTLASQVSALADTLALGTALPAASVGNIVLDSGKLNQWSLGGLVLGAQDLITVDGALQLANGGNVTLYAPQVAVNADITAHGGTINIGNALLQVSDNNRYEDSFQNPLTTASVQVADNVQLDASGLWSNLLTDASDAGALNAVNGGTVTLRSSGDVSLGQGSVIDVSSGAQMLASGKTRGGKGGSVRLQSGSNSAATSNIAVGGALRAYGVNGGGTLTIDTGRIDIGGVGSVGGVGILELAADSFNKGFSSYVLTGLEGISVADGAQVDVTMPVYRIADGAATQAAGSTTALELLTPPLYVEDAAKGRLTQRKGASITLQAGSPTGGLAASYINTSEVRIGSGAGITVDPGQSITLTGVGQITVDRGARLNAWGGNITLAEFELSDQVGGVNDAYLTGDKRSIWIGEDAVLDVAARAVTAVDALGRRYGIAGNGGSIVLGGTVDAANGRLSTKNQHVFIALREGAVLEASGAQATVDVTGLGAVTIAGSGGNISIAGTDGLYLDGAMHAASGGGGAAGGSLTVALDLPSYERSAPAELLAARELLIGQLAQSSGLAAGLSAADGTALMTYGQARLGVDQVQAGGFGQLTLFGRGGIGFDGNVALSMSQSLSLYAPSLNQRDTALASTAVSLAAPYVRVSGIGPFAALTPDVLTLPAVAATAQPLLPATFTASGSLVDLRDTVELGFGLTTFDSSGDLRLLASISPVQSGASYSTVIRTAGDITLRAAQVYPATGALASIQAGAGWGMDPNSGDPLFNPDSVIRIERNGSGTPAMPYSVFGNLQIGAAHIEQGGVLRAPLGALSLGGGEGFADNVTFLPGSLTSVSAAGLVMPYGGTVDGISYTYNGKDVVLVGVGGSRSVNDPVFVQGMTIKGVAVDVQAGATLDLSGGGDLTGAAFISGRGGSTDARVTPLMQIGKDGSFSLPSLASNPVYAIVPGVQASQAPAVSPGGATDPLIGQQITIGAGAPGLAAGTYTLMPSTYALLPGAYRVELNGSAGLGAAFATTALRNGSTAVAAQLSIANTGIADTLFRQAIVTPAATVRTYSQYNEMSYAQFIAADAERRGVPRAMSPADGKSLQLKLGAGAGADALRVNGTSDFSAALGGYAGSVIVTTQSTYPPNTLEIVAPGAAATPSTVDTPYVTVHSDSLNQFNASRIVIGSVPVVVYGQSGNVVDFGSGDTGFIILRSGAMLSAPEVFLVSAGLYNDNHVVIEPGASINTIGRGAASYGAADGFTYRGGYNVVAVSNGVLNFVPNSSVSYSTAADNGLRVGVCSAAPCSGVTELYSEGSIVLATNSSFVLDDSVRYGTRNLTVSVPSVNAGSTQSLADAAARGVLPDGLAMNQDVLNRLLAGDTQYGAPALETFFLNARDSINFFGSTVLSTVDPVTGKSSLQNLVLTTPAIYGYGGASDLAVIETGNLIWGGATTSPGTVISQGAGTGSGTLDIRANSITFGYGPFAQPNNADVMARIALGFANVNLTASDRITANHKGSLAVYQSQGAFDSVANAYQYSGGNLNMVTPLLTGEAASVNSLTAGGALTLSTPAGVVPAATGRSDMALGGELTLAGDSVRLDSAIALPSGKLTVSAEHDLSLDAQSSIDMAGRAVDFFDVTKYSWGGDVSLESRSGNLRQAAGSVIDLSAANNHAGSLKASALSDVIGAGVVDLQGSILGSASGKYDAGGTMVPYLAATIDVAARALGDSGAQDDLFAALNTRLNSGDVTGGRSFRLRSGDLVIGDELKAGEINVSLDNGNLTVAGTIDASGERVGTIRLAAGGDLTLAGNAVLDAHGRTLRVDSYGKIIDSPNRAIVELSAGENGTLTLASGTRIDLRAGTDATVGSAAGQNDGAPRGTLTLNAFRTGEISGDVRIDAGGSLDITGARTINVNAMWRYTDAPDGTDPLITRPYQEITQAYLDGKHLSSVDFITAALNNSNLMDTRLAGLRAYNDAFHLRPAVEIASRTADGDLMVTGDLDLSGYRYQSVNPNSQKTGASGDGSGEAGFLVLRAGGDLNIYGSINDGFAAPPATIDDNGWVLLAGKEFTGSAVVVPRSGVVLDDGTTFEAGQTLNYDLPIKAQDFDGGQRIPVASKLEAPMDVPAGTVFSANVYDDNGVLLHALGERVTAAETLPAGTRFDAGMRLPVAATLSAMLWPKNVALPKTALGANLYVVDGQLTLPLGGVIPAGTKVALPGGATSVDLRDSNASGVGSQGRLWALAAMLPEGSQSWDMRMVAGADLGAADNRLTQAHAASGSLRMADNHYGTSSSVIQNYLWTAAILDYDSSLIPGTPVDADYFGYASAQDLCSSYPSLCQAYGAPTAGPSYISGTRFSVVRTGAADMDLLAARNISMDTLYGVYTAGTSSTATSANDPYNLPRARNVYGTVLNDTRLVNEKFVDGGAESIARAWYPTGGGNLTVKAGGDISGNQMYAALSNYNRPTTDYGYDTTLVSNWLWRQGSGSTLGGGNDQLTAWYINFGTYIGGDADAGLPDSMRGFTGLGTLGGGNLRVEAGGNAGTLTRTLDLNSTTAINARTQELVLAVASTGRVAADGSLTLTGGGDLDVRIGGALNPVSSGSNPDQRQSSIRQVGALIDLRGNVQLQAGELGRIVFTYSNEPSRNTNGETRALSAFVATQADAFSGPLLVPGDATFSLTSRGDQVAGGVRDAGRVEGVNTTPLTALTRDPSDATRYLPTGFGQSWFSLWTDNTAIDMFSAGGNLVPLAIAQNAQGSDLSLVLPGTLRAVAASGSIYYGNAAAELFSRSTLAQTVLAPSSKGQLEMLAQGNIYAGSYTISQSGGAAASMATPFATAFLGITASGDTVSNLNADGSHVATDRPEYPLFAFGSGTTSADLRGNGEPARFYAVQGDLVGVSSGRAITFDESPSESRAGQLWYEGAQPVWMIAGRDIVSGGTALGTVQISGTSDYYTATTNLFVHGSTTDVSLVSAGRDILYSSFAVAGPGTLEITAGRDILMENRASINSIGAIVAGDKRAGADIAIMAGVGASGPDFAGLIARYLDPANLAATGTSLASQPGKVAKTYEAELVTWLAQRYGFSGDVDAARAFYAALPAEQQRIFARQVYFAELAAGAREYNDPDSVRFGSYLRGRNMIASLFPETDASGNKLTYAGDLTMYGNAGVHTLFGGDIQVMTPGGRQVFGVEGTNPAGSAGVITQGAGSIALYSLDSILLGQSRIMTTFGGDILAWSADGDINAGRGAKSTVVYTPPKRTYDRWGNVTLSSDVPSTGAGIATLAPIPEVAAGDIDLIAPLGTVDAGEAGIRVSGNINIAALQVVNAANIQVQGKSTGLPTVAAVNVGALTNASNAANSAATAAQDAMARQRAAARDNLPSIFTVRVLGFGEEGQDRPATPAPTSSLSPAGAAGYDRNGLVQLVGEGKQLDAAYLARLTPEQRRLLRQER